MYRILASAKTAKGTLAHKVMLFLSEPTCRAAAEAPIRQTIGVVSCHNIGQISRLSRRIFLKNRLTCPPQFHNLIV